MYWLISWFKLTSLDSREPETSSSSESSEKTLFSGSPQTPFLAFLACLARRRSTCESLKTRTRKVRSVRQRMATASRSKRVVEMTSPRFSNTNLLDSPSVDLASGSSVAMFDSWKGPRLSEVFELASSGLDTFTSSTSPRGSV